MDHRPRTWELDVPTERVPGGIVLAPKGRIGSVTAAVFGNALTLAVRSAPRVIVDLAGVDYLSGLGIQAIQAALASNGSQITLCGLQDPVRIALELGRALGGVVVVNTREEALESLRPDG